MSDGELQHFELLKKVKKKDNTLYGTLTLLSPVLWRWRDERRPVAKVEKGFASFFLLK